jgi:hypothetical protein
MTKHQLWEELVFGDTDLYAYVCEHFADKAESMYSGEFCGIDARLVVKAMLRHRGQSIASTMATALDTPGIPGPFASHVYNNFRTRLDSPPEAIVDEIVEALPEDVGDAAYLPVHWPDELSY